MAHPSDPELLVLHALRLRSFVDGDVVASASRQPEPLVAALLEEFEQQGWVAHRSGRIQGWSLTSAGRIEGERRLAAELDATGCRTVVDDAYRRFVGLNAAFLSLCTRWQVRDADGVQIVNDHTDAAYDAGIVAQLDRIDDDIQPVCHDLATALVRFSYYNGRFATARLRVHDGEHDWFIRPIIDSYHTVWFELHENLLATLNIERAGEHRVSL